MRFSLLICFFCSAQVFSQQWLGISSSNYNGLNAIYQNPANVVDSRYKCVINIAGGNIEFNNNYAGWAAPFSLISLATNNVSNDYRNAGGKIVFKNSYIKEANQRQNSAAFLGGDARTPAIMYNFTKAKFAIALTSRARFMTNMTKLSPEIGRVLVEGTSNPDYYDIPQENTHVNLNINGYTELGATLGIILKEQGQDFLKAGLTFKRVNGLLNTYLQADNLDFTISQHPTRPQRQIINIAEANGKFGMVSMTPLGSVGFAPAWFIGNLPMGIGYGADIGIVYEYRPDFQKYEFRHKGKTFTDGTRNKYRFKIGVALLDFGSINYKQLDNVQITNVARSSINIQPGTFTKVNSTDKFYRIFNSSFAIPESDYQETFSIPLPAAFNINFDYKISEKLYLNTFWLQSLRNTNSKGMIQPSVLAFVPRYESKFFDVCVPISLQNGYRNIAYGVSFRAGGVYIGSDNLAGFFKLGNPHGINAYAGAFIPIHRRLPSSPNECYTEMSPSFMDKWKNNRFKRRQNRRWRNLR